MQKLARLTLLSIHFKIQSSKKKKPHFLINLINDEKCTEPSLNFAPLFFI